MIDLRDLQRVLGGEVSAGRLLCPGPDHSAADRSLSVKLDSDAPDGFLVHSFAGDDPLACKDYIRQKLSMPAFKPTNGGGNGRRRASDDAIERALMAAVQGHNDNKPKGRVVATYDYTDAIGALLYQVLRLEPKSFRQRRPDGNGGWIWKLDERRVLYRLPNLLEYPDATVFVCEGEKDADRVIALGHCATTVAAGKWTEECIEALAGRDCIILQDNDAPGTKKAQAAAQVLYPSAKSVRVVLLPDLPDGGDVSDWLDTDPHRADKLVDVCFDAPVWEPDNNTNKEEDPGFREMKDDAEETKADDGTKTEPPASLGEWDAGDDTEPPPPRGWLLGNIFARGFMSSLFAEGGTGKTALRYAQYLSLATGKSLTGEHVFQRCRVLIVSLEDDAKELRRRILAAMLHYGIDRSEVHGWLFLAAPGAAGGKLMILDKKGRTLRGKLADTLKSVIVKRKIDLISLDPFVKTHSVEENSNSAIDDVVQALTDMAAKHDIGIDVPHHTSKGTADPGNANRGRGAGAMKDGSRLIYTLATMTPEEAQTFGISEEQRRCFVRMDSAKVNIAPPAAHARWFRLIGIPLGNATEKYPQGDTVQTVEPWVPPDIWTNLSADALNRILTVIDDGLPDGNRYSDARSATDRAAWKVIVDHAPDKTEAQAREVIKTWVKNGVLVRYSYVNPATRKPVTGLRVDHTKRPST